MAAEKKKASPKKSIKSITDTDLYAINKNKKIREELNLSQPNIDVNTEISIGALGKIENPGALDKLSFGQLNILTKYYNSEAERKKMNNDKETDPGEGDKVSLHDYFVSEPLIAKQKVNKIIADSVKIEGPDEAISTLLASGFFDAEYVSVKAIHDECEKLFNRTFIIDSIRTRLSILAKDGILDRIKMGVPLTYHYKKVRK